LVSHSIDLAFSATRAEEKIWITFYGHWVLGKNPGNACHLTVGNNLAARYYLTVQCLNFWGVAVAATSWK
jgi:hypothetical protein